MTSKENRAPSGAARREYVERTEQHALIRNGLLPGLDELLEGAPWYGGSINKDIQAWCDVWLTIAALPPQRGRVVGKRKIPDATDPRQLVTILRSTCSLESVKLVHRALKSARDEDQWRMLCYASCMSDRAAAAALAKKIGDESDNGYRGGTFDDLFRECTMLGLLTRDKQSMADYCGLGSVSIEADATMLTDYRNAAQAIAEEAAQKAAKQEEKPAPDEEELSKLAALRGADPTDAEFLRAVLEDRAEFIAPSEQFELVVVPTLGDSAGSSARRDMYKSWRGIDSTPLPIVRRGDIAAHRRALVEQWPHATEIIDTILGDLAAREQVRFRPTLLVGKPGSGKSSLARAICETLGLPVELYSMAGMADGSVGGTSAQWSTARESVPLQLIKRSKHASVAIVWDEIEKAATSSYNGSALETLLPMLEIDQAKRFRDLALEVEVNLSYVSHFATANSLEGVPAPVKDRMRVLTMPEPTWAHLGTLTRQIIERIAEERGVDPRWFSPLAEDELDLVRSAWPGGSIRQLTRIVTTIVDGRDQIIGRC